MKKIKILLADDEEILVEMYEILLDSEFKCDFVKASNGEEAITLLSTHQDIDIIISDYNMPLMNGGAVFVYNLSHQNIPFFLVSGGEIKDYPDFKNFIQKNSLNKFFNKPFNEKHLIEAVREIIEQGK